MPHGNLRDLLRLAMKGDPFMDGRIALKTKIDIPPLGGKVSRKLLLDGQFNVTQAKFLQSKIQDQIDTLSRRGRGKPEAEEIVEVPSGIAGTFQLANEVITCESVGNAIMAVHLASAALIILGGMIQLIPQIRRRAPHFHRWLGRVYIATAFTISLAGLYMMWVRGTVGDLPQHLGNTLLAILIMLFAAITIRYAVAGDLKTHRRWALRLYLAVSGSLFIRAFLYLTIALNGGPFGFNPTTLSGPFLTFISFAQYAVPLALLEIYLRLEKRPKAFARLVLAGGLGALSIALGLGIAAVSTAVWLPHIKQAYDKRKPITDVLIATITSAGIEDAKKQYRQLKVDEPNAYNFDEPELNNLGYQFIRDKKFKEAIAVFELNVESYPQSSNVYDSLGEAYLNDGDKPDATANYQKSLKLNPNNQNASLMLQRLNVR